jgi:hypothetical protein
MGSPAGYAFFRQILKGIPLTYEPHDCQINGVCQSLDGVNLLASRDYTHWQWQNKLLHHVHPRSTRCHR